MVFGGCAQAADFAISSMSQLWGYPRSQRPAGLPAGLFCCRMMKHETKFCVKRFCPEIGNSPNPSSNGLPPLFPFTWLFVWHISIGSQSLCGHGKPIHGTEVLKLRRKTRPRSLRCLKARWQVGFCDHGLLKLVDFRFLGIDM